MSIPAVLSPGAYERAYANRRAFFNSFLTTDVSPMTDWEWLKSMPSKRRKALIRAHQHRLERGENHAEYDLIKPFVKTEHLPYFSQLEDDYTHEGVEYVARLIQAPHDETHLDAGKWLKPLVALLKQDWVQDNWLFYASVAPEKLDLWLNRNAHAMSFFGSDYTSFDATYTERTWWMVERFYSIIYPDAPVSFWNALKAWRACHGKVKCKKDETTLEYWAPNCNTSGRDDTALANALVNGIVIATAFAAALNGISVTDVTVEHIVGIREKVQIAVVGDDSLVACYFDVSLISDKVVAGIREFGLIAKAQVCQLHEVTFLGMMPYPVSGQYYWGPTIGRRMYKAFWQAEPVGNLPAWTLGVAKQLALYRCVPVLSDIANRVVELLAGGKSTPVSHDPNRIWATRSSATPAYDITTQWFLCQRYSKQGLTLAAMEADRRVVQSISRLPAVVKLFTTDAAVIADEL